jgi:hypothetical protein
MPILKAKHNGEWINVTGDSNATIIDSTLSKSGQAADAKAVGDALKNKQPIGNYVKTVNGAKPDGNGNVQIEIAPTTDSVNSDWNQNDPTKPDYVKNRTHWEEGNQTIIEWDGNTEGLEQWDFTMLGSMLYKVSDATPTLDELYGGLLGAYLGDNYTEMELVGQDYNDVIDLNNEINPVNCKFVGRFFIVYDTDVNFYG